MLRQLKRERLYEAVADEIKRYIVDRGLNPGDNLPSERELCRSLNVGRTSLREGLRQLQMLGLIEIKSGLGAFIRKDDLQSFLARATEPLAINRSELAELIEIREPLEVFAAQLAAQRATPEQIQRLQAQLASDRDKVVSGAYHVEDDLAFHLLIFEASRNTILLRFVSLVGDLLVSYRELYLTSPGVDKRTLTEHTAIFDAIRDGRTAVAVRLMREHVRDTARALRDAEARKAAGGEGR
jgi:GntR family transcriptional repressor for pyruvate dehydrogenase complex